MLDHRAVARAGAPHGARRPRAASFFALDLTDGSRAFRLRFLAGGVCRSVTLHERSDCNCGCDRGWNRHLAYVELLRLRVQTWTPSRGGERA